MTDTTLTPTATPANPMGLNLITMAQQSLGAYITELVKYEVAQALAAQTNDKAAATLLDDELTKRIQDVAAAYLEDNMPEAVDDQRVREIAKDVLDDHTSDYDHDDFLTEITDSDVEDAVDNVLEGKNLTPVDAGDEDFRSAVCNAVRNSLG